MNFNCYIDESGDEGIETGGSRWFILGALMVPEDADLKTSEMVQRIKKTFSKDDKWVLHWSKIRKHDQKRYICKELQTESWKYACVASDKTHPFIIRSRGLREKNKLYFYSVRLLLERISWYTRDNGNGIANPIFEYRSNTRYDDMREYLLLLRGWMPESEVKISWNNVNYRNFRILPKSKSRLLQASDCVCGALKDGLEYSGYNLIEPTYILSLKEHLYRRQGNLFSYGLKFLHIKPGDLDTLKTEYQWLKII
jgi:hypothetical protein